MRKRLELAKSLAMRPKLLLLDEVNAGLNATEIDGALDLIRAIAARGVTILIIEHLMKVVLSLCTRIVVLHHGELIAEGDAADDRARRARRAGLSRRRYARRRRRPMAEPLLEVAGPRRRLRRRAGAVGRRPRGAARRDHRPRRLQRRGQDHADAHHLRADRRARRPHRVRRPGSRERARPTASSAPASRTCRRAGGCSPP